MNIDAITGSVVDTCIKIHSTLGPGCFERVYEEILYFELSRKKTVHSKTVNDADSL